jgi:hypothetical protein
MRARVIACTDLELAHARGKLIGKHLGDALLDDHTGRRRTRLTFVVKTALERVTNGTVDVRVVEHQERILSSEFKQCRGDMACSRLRDRGACFRRPRK